MAFRAVPQDDQEFEAWVKDVNERVARLEAGGAHRGRVSFDQTIDVGDMEISVKPGGGDALGDSGLVVTFRNTLAGDERSLALRFAGGTTLPGEIWMDGPVHIGEMQLTAEGAGHVLRVANPDHPRGKTILTLGPVQIIAVTAAGPPMFTDEGPSFYAAAFAHNSPFAKGAPYKTVLAAGRETAFRAWVTAESVPFDPDEDPTDYDMRGFWLENVVLGKGVPWVLGAHFPDTYKTPYDTSFSRESKYAKASCPFEWEGDFLIDESDNTIVFGDVGAGVPPIVRLKARHPLTGDSALLATLV